MIVRIMTYRKEHPRKDEKYIGLEVHQATIVVAVMDSTGKLVMEYILETSADSSVLRGLTRNPAKVTGGRRYFANYEIHSGLATRTKPLARRTLPRGSTERVQELLT